MDAVKAICKCKQLSETEPVLAIKEKPLESWGFFTWIITIILVVVTAGGWLPFVIGWVLGSYFLAPTYRCQYCKSNIDKDQFRA